MRALWNFAPMDLKVPEGVVANNVHLTDSLLVLTYRLHQMEAREEAAPQKQFGRLIRLRTAGTRDAGRFFFPFYLLHQKGKADAAPYLIPGFGIC